MRKKVLSIVLAVCLLVGCLPMAASAANIVEYPINGGTIYFDKDTGTITSSTKDLSGALEIPAEIDGVAVTSVWRVAFDNCQELTSVTIPNSVTSLGKRAFSSCPKLVSLSIPESVTEIGEDVFAACDNLVDLQVSPNNPNFCARDAVLYSKDMATLVACSSARKGELVVPSGVTKIERYAFRHCTTLTAIVLPEGVTEIDIFAFWNCGTTSITLPASLEHIEPQVFYSTSGLTEFKVADDSPYFCAEDGVLYNKDKTALIRFPCKKGGEFTVPNTVESIETFAFLQCDSLTSVTIPDSVTKIWGSTFAATNDFTICASLGSCAATYAAERGLKFEAVEFPEPAVPTPGPVGPGPAPGPVTPVPTATPTPTPAAFNFVDVPASAYYFDAVKWAVEKGITAGTDATHFSPNGPCTRAQAVTFLWRSAGKPEPKRNYTFLDVEKGSYYEKAVSWAIEMGITSGTGGGKFSPDLICDRGQITTFLWRADGKPVVPAVTSFTDVKPGAFYEKAAQWAAAKKITSGTGKGTFSPNAPCTRSQVVTFLYRYYQ